MVGARTAVIVSLFAGLAYVAGQQQFARDLIGSDTSWKSRLQILVGRPAPEIEPSDDEPAASLAAAVTNSRPERSVERSSAAPAEQRVQISPRTRDEASAEPSPAAQEDIEAFDAEFVAIEGANLRREPSLDARRVDVIGKGRRIEVTGRTLDRRWYRVLHRGEARYISASTVRPTVIETSLGTVYLDEVERELEAMAQDLKRARFREVLRAARPVRLQLERAGRWVALDASIVRLEIMAATCELALGRQEDASLSLERALAVDRGLALDPVRSPPKLRRLLEEVRESR